MFKSVVMFDKSVIYQYMYISNNLINAQSECYFYDDINIFRLYLYCLKHVHIVLYSCNID